MGVKEMVAEARKRVNGLSVAQVREEGAHGAALVVDIRDVRERWREGSIPGARHVPRGLLEFWSDPEDRYHRDFMDPEGRVILFCAEGERSALAADTLQKLGYRDVAHLEGGFLAWREADGEVEAIERK
jgi:rhodanese-related sulfurtransferase